MSKIDIYLLKNKAYILLSLAFFLFSISIYMSRNSINIGGISFSYENVNTKNIAEAIIYNKKSEVEARDLSLKEEVEIINDSSESNEDIYGVKEEVTNNNNYVEGWHLPTEVGRITQYPHYGHPAYDITSYRGTNETIYPVAHGVISSIYKDRAGALIVTLRHFINGRVYTSQYVHMSSYAPGLYVGKEMSINDPIGKMGSTGISTGNHLHLTVIDCNLYSQSDYNCSNLNGFFKYANYRVTQGYYGLGNHIKIPSNWYSRY